MAKRVMITGSIGGTALGYGGHTWAILQYILGFRRLGYDVYYVEHLSAKKVVDDDWNLTSRIGFGQTRNPKLLRTKLCYSGSQGNENK